MLLNKFVKMQRIALLHHLRQSLARVSSTVQPVQYSRKFSSKPDLPLVPNQYVQHQYKPLHHSTEPVIDWNSEMQEIYKEESSHSLLDIVEDESLVDAEPRVGLTFNLAAYAPKSPALQALVKLGVNLYKIERRKGLASYLINLDFERHMKEHIFYLSKEIGLETDLLSTFLTKNPLIFKTNIDDLRCRVNYLESKRFKPDEITHIVERNPFWLMFSTERIDKRLGFFQREFELTGNEVRKLTVLLPAIVTYKLDQIRELTFSVREELELSRDETRRLLLKCPQIWLTNRTLLMERYDILTREMKLPQELILENPTVLQVRSFILRERHGFLKSLGRAQYDRKIDLYVPLDAIGKGTNEEFAVNVAKSTYEEFDRYLRTL